jgi:hypothetical protein
MNTPVGTLSFIIGVSLFINGIDSVLILVILGLFKAVDDAMKIDSNSPEAKQFLITLVDILEQVLIIKQCQNNK